MCQTELGVRAPLMTCLPCSTAPVLAVQDQQMTSQAAQRSPGRGRVRLEDPLCIHAHFQPTAVTVAVRLQSIMHWLE